MPQLNPVFFPCRGYRLDGPAPESIALEEALIPEARPVQRAGVVTALDALERLVLLRRVGIVAFHALSVITGQDDMLLKAEACHTEVLKGKLSPA